jgi:hypothetical protein
LHIVVSEAEGVLIVTQEAVGVEVVVGFVGVEVVVGFVGVEVVVSFVGGILCLEDNDQDIE